MASGPVCDEYDDFLDSLTEQELQDAESQGLALLERCQSMPSAQSSSSDHHRDALDVYNDPEDDNARLERLPDHVSEFNAITKAQDVATGDVTTCSEHESALAQAHDVSFTNIRFASNNQAASSSIRKQSNDANGAPQKRGPGRPKGSKNNKSTLKRKADAPDSDSDSEVGAQKEKRPVGRPRGSGPNQQEDDTDGQVVKRPVGRPSKKPRGPLFGVQPETSRVNRGLVALALPALGPAARAIRNAQNSAVLSTTQDSTVASIDDSITPAADTMNTSSIASITRSKTPAVDATTSDACYPLHVAPATGEPPSSSSNKSSSTSSLTPADDPPSVDHAVHPSPSAPAPSERPLIPEEDPSQMITEGSGDDNEEDHTTGLFNDGLGEEDEDEDEDESVDTPARNRRGMRSPRPLPIWLRELFNSRVEESKKRGSNGLPPLYRDHKTFWFPQRSAFFRLQEHHISPQKLYDAKMFLWDPMSLVPDGIMCPNPGCKARLWRHSHVLRPRRVVDINQTFWIIGYRYRCSKCVRPASVTFRSWDPRILAVLPRPLAAEFPARLSYRSGISLSTFDFMRSCFQHGMGAKQFSNALLVQHLQHYDRLQLCYLQTLASRSIVSTLFRGQKYEGFLPYDDQSEGGLRGYIPSSQWLRDMYDSFIEDHQQEFNQHMSMLTGNICAIDHSFKLTKHVAKVDGVQVFTALLTVTNEKGEIRVCSLVATKSHSQFELALRRMRESLELYGHDQPCIFYTDNMADKDFLERCFPSLRLNTVPVEKYAQLEPLLIPEHYSITTKDSATTIDDAMRTILELLPDDDSPGTITIGLDAEWNVEISDRGYATGRGQTAILQIAHGTKIFILQVGHILAGKTLPPLLKQVLSNPKIIKVGRCVSGDLKYLQEACQSPVPFVGGVDLAKFAKDRLVVKTARVSLSDLCAAVLGKRLNKNVSERTSMAWEEKELTAEQIRYAALDVYASLSIHSALVNIPTPSPLPDTLEPGLPVLLFNNDRTRLVARGVISPHAHDSTFHGINITPSRTVIEIHNILVPGALVANGTSDKTLLQDCGTLPCHILCLRNHLRQSAPEISLPLAASASSHSSDDTPADNLNDISELLSISQYSTSHSSDSIEQDSGSHEGLGDILRGTFQSTTFDTSQTPTNHSSDPISQTEGERVLQAVAAKVDNDKWSDHIRSRVLKDPFHVFNMFYISAAHGLLQEFAVALRDAIFIPDVIDKARIVAWGQTQSPPQSWTDILFKRADWLWRRCKRIIPPPEKLYPLVAKVFETYGPLKDAKSGLPLFNTAAWAIAKNVLELTQKGFLSDPPGILLYYQLGIDAKTGLPIYRCIRGTNMTEGGVHTHLRSRLPTSGVSIRHVQCCLLDFILRHNLLVGTFNSSGKRYIGHYSIWITNELQETLCLVQHMLRDPQLITGWVNGNLYHPTKEVAGVLPIPDDLRMKSGMGAYVRSLHSKQPHHFLASMQGTRKPVLPIHNSEERTLFRDLMTGDSGFNDPVSGPNWDVAVQLWNNEADVKGNISYKLSEQLKVYYNGDWKKSCNIKQTLAMTAAVRLPVKTSLRDPQRSLGAPNIPEGNRTHHSVSKGFLPLPSVNPLAAAAHHTHPLSLNENENNEHTTPQSNFAAENQTLQDIPQASSAAGNQASSSSASSVSASAPSVNTVMMELSRQRAQDAIPDAPNRTRQRRTCQKCADIRCPGSQKVDNCRNPCRDCQRIVGCRGRNSKRPKTPCHLAWD